MEVLVAGVDMGSGVGKVNGECEYVQYKTSHGSVKRKQWDVKGRNLGVETTKNSKIGHFSPSKCQILDYKLKNTTTEFSTSKINAGGAV